MIYGLFIGGPVRSFLEFHYSELTDARSGRRWSLAEGEQSDPSRVRYIMYKSFNIFAAWFRRTGSKTRGLVYWKFYV